MDTAERGGLVGARLTLHRSMVPFGRTRPSEEGKRTEEPRGPFSSLAEPQEAGRANSSEPGPSVHSVEH